MNVRPSEEQELLRDMVRRFLADRCPAADAGRGVMPAGDWRALGELGVLGATIPEAAGGLGGSAQEAMILGEELGRALTISPFAETIVAAADLVARHGSDAQRGQWLTPALGGDIVLALAIGAVRDDGGSLHGSLDFVRWGVDAAALVVVDRDRAWIVGSDAAGLTRDPIRLADGSSAAMVLLDGAAGDQVALPPGAAVRALAMAQLGYVAEMVGTMALLREQTAAYVRQREQFGVAIGTFQVVQHKLARMFVKHEQSQSLLLKAALTPREGPTFVRNVTAAKAYVAEAAQQIAEEAVQLHGGMGVTDELPVGRALRRVIVLARLFGRADEARLALAATHHRRWTWARSPGGAGAAGGFALVD